MSFRREAFVPKGGPDGGDGGKGGDVWIVATTRRSSLSWFVDHPHQRAGNGAHGEGRRRHGAAGRDAVVEVPVGTVVKDQQGRLLADLARAGDRLLAAEGGRGGVGNARFATSRLQAPSFAEQGEVGEERWLRLELKLLADVAVVGLPNAGKSSLVAAISRARPKVAPYPFTTLAPQLGVVRMREADFTIADVPGLIEGASEGRGLGHRFLRHIERASVLLFLIDLASAEHQDPNEQEAVLLGELEAYDRVLLERPRLVVGSRSDIAPPGVVWSGLRVSSATRQGLDDLIRILFEMVERSRAQQPAETPEFALHRLAPEPPVVRKLRPHLFEVIGREATRAVAFSDLGDPAAGALAWRRLRRLGVDRALRRQGVQEGDEVRVGGASLVWTEAALGRLEGNRSR